MRRDLGHRVTHSPIVLDRVNIRHGSRVVIRDLSGRFEPGTMTALLGANGAGKTTLLRALAGQHPIAEGRIDTGGLTPAEIAVLPQLSELDRGFPIFCGDVVALGRTGRAGLFRPIASTKHVEAALDAAGLPGFAARPIGALSAGQFQRVMFARMMLQDAPVLLLDEPFSAIDTATALDLMAILSNWRAQGRTIVVALHDLELAREAFPQTLLLAGDATAWGPTGTVLAQIDWLAGRPFQAARAQLDAA